MLILAKERIDLFNRPDNTVVIIARPSSSRVGDDSGEGVTPRDNR